MKRACNLILLYVVFCLVGAGLEWGYGVFWSKVGTTPWIYPESFMHYTSLEGLPLWGFGGFIIIAIYKAITQGKPKFLVNIAVPIALAIIWITIYSCLGG